jgi:[ribosomal protein S5]-alanine N-acetyltransferase
MYLPLNGPRLQLREFIAADAARMHEIYADPEVMRWVGHGAVGSRTESDAMLDGYSAHQQLHGYSFWAVVVSATGRVIGDAGLYGHDGEVELGYTLAREAWGKGYATEAGRLCVEAAFGDLGLEALVAITRPENPGSAHVLMKLGFTRTGQKLDYGHIHDLYRLGNPDTGGEG